VWTYDFVHDQLANGGPLKMLCVLDEKTRDCLGIEVGKSLPSEDVILTVQADANLWKAGLHPLG
jgi:putative transposase